MDASSPLSSAEGVVELDSFTCWSFVGPFLFCCFWEPSLWEAEFLSSHRSQKEFLVAVLVRGVEGAVVGSCDKTVVVVVPSGLCVEVANEEEICGRRGLLCNCFNGVPEFCSVVCVVAVVWCVESNDF